jgi:pimeloyl-ACP methyl ester carboxylesterase
VTTYGLTEAGSGVTALPVAEGALAPGSAGRPLPGIELRVVDAQDVPVGPRQRGSIVVAGPTLATAYDGDAEATSARFVSGMFRTGDLGMLDDEGRLWVVDRQDELIISGGENISPAEVEAVLATHPGLADVAVVARPDAAWGAVPVAAVVPHPGRGAPTTQELRDFARDRLAGFKLPADVRIVAEVPRTASGKILRREVSALLDASAPDAPTTPRSHAIARPDGAIIHAETLGSGPLLLLLHATLSTAHDLGPLASRLARTFRVVSVDRRSAGASRMPPDDPGGAVDIASHVDDVLGVLDVVAPGERALAVGHSFGGCVALELAAWHPHRVTAAWVFEPPYLALLRAADVPDLTALGDRIAALGREQGPAAAALAFLDTVRGPGTSARLPEAARTRLGAEGRGAIADAALLGLDPRGLRRIMASVVVALGGRGGGPYAAVAAAITGRVSTATVERFPDLGHGGPTSRPDVVASSIAALAARTGLIPEHAVAPAEAAP